MQNNQTEFTCNGILLAVGQIWRLENNAHCVITSVNEEGIVVEDCTKEGISFNNPYRRYTTIHNDGVFAKAKWCGHDELDFAEFIGTKKENEMQSNQSNLISMHKQYKTRDGRNVRVLCVDGKSNAGYTVFALIDDGDYEDSASFTNDGFYFNDKCESPSDLIEVKPFVFIPEVGRKYKSRIGETWTILLTNCGDGNYPVVAYKEEGGFNQIDCFTVKGECWQGEANNDDMIAYAD
jgi:hypothetical protein